MFIEDFFIGLLKGLLCLAICLGLLCAAPAIELLVDYLLQ